MLKILSAIFLLLVTGTACGGQSHMQKHDRKVGGCAVDTIPLGLGTQKTDPGRVVEHLVIKAVHDAGHETFVRAAGDLALVLKSAGVTVYDRSELIHVTEGACWPPWRITFDVDLGGPERSEATRKLLLGSTIAGLEAAEKRPDDYGRFFISAGKGSSDLWTVWFAGDDRADEKVPR